VGSYLGVDVSRTALEIARGLGLEVRQIDDAAELPFDDGSFDAALCLEAFEHLFAPHECAREIARVLRPGGRLIATVPNAANWRHRFDLAVHGLVNPYGDELSAEEPWRDPHIRFFVAGSLRQMLLQAGFSQVLIGGHNDRSALLDLPPRALSARLARHQEPGPLLRRLTAARPSFFGMRLHAVAVK
jgi:SAM-dependent methyltransferase